MKIIIIRHADRVRGENKLSERGRVESKLLMERLLKMNIDEIFISTMERAVDTVSDYLS